MIVITLTAIDITSIASGVCIKTHTRVANNNKMEYIILVLIDSFMGGRNPQHSEHGEGPQQQHSLKNIKTSCS